MSCKVDEIFFMGVKVLFYFLNILLMSFKLKSTHVR